MPAPFPDDPGFWAGVAQGWRDAETVAAQHRAHVIVLTVGDSDTPLASARLTTAVAGALIASVPECSAVVWCAKVAKPAEAWEEMSRKSFAPYPDYPFMLWIDALPFRSETGLGVVTTGLSEFVGREIEFESDRLDVVTLFRKTLGLAAYLIEHGDKVKDGDTFGGSEQERLTVHHKMSERFGGLPVLFCAME